MDWVFFPFAVLEDCALSLSDCYLLAGKAGWSFIWLFRNLNSVRNACDLQLSERPQAPSLSTPSTGAAMGRCTQAALFAALWRERAGELCWRLWEALHKQTCTSNSLPDSETVLDEENTHSSLIPLSLPTSRAAFLQCWCQGSKFVRWSLTILQLKVENPQAMFFVALFCMEVPALRSVQVNIQACFVCCCFFLNNPSGRLAVWSPSATWLTSSKNGKKWCFLQLIVDLWRTEKSGVELYYMAAVLSGKGLNFFHFLSKI